MANNRTKYTLEIDADLGQLDSKLNTMKSKLASVLSSGQAPKGLEKSFEQISNLIGKIQDKTSKPLVSAFEFNSVTKDLSALESAFNGLGRELENIGDLSDELKITLLPPEEQNKINQAIKSLKQYHSEMAALAKQQEVLSKAQKAQGRAKTKKEDAGLQVEKLSADKTKKSETKAAKEFKLSKIEDKDSQAARTLDLEIKKLEQDLGLLEKKIELAQQRQGEANEEFNRASETVANLQREVSGMETKSLDNLRKQASALGIELNKVENESPEDEMRRLATAIQNVQNSGLNRIPEILQEMSGSAAQAKTEISSLSDEVNEASVEFKGMEEAASQKTAFESKIKQFLGLSGAAHVMRAALRDAMKTITELDATMTEMAVVTDLSVGDYWDQLPEYSKRASDLGVSINSAYKAATLYYQQGLKTNEVVAISTETLKMAKIAGMDAADATDKMTAALRGFNMELNEASARRVSDVYSELAAVTAASTQEIANAMTKTASIASSAGMEFETTAAFLSQIIETTRESAETAGTAMKTVIARFQELKKAPEDIGEVDGEIVDANQIETALRSVGVSLRDASGSFRDLDDVFLELSSKWDGLDKNTQRYIATIAAGSRQQSRFIAMMSDYGRTQELVSKANTSAGASNEQFEKTMDSLEAKLEKLKNAWHEFTMGILNSDLVKAGVDILTKFFEIINKITHGLGDKGIGGGLTKIMSVLTIFKMGMKIFEKFKQPVIALFSEIVRQAGISGEKSGQAYKEGLQRSQTAGAKTPGTAKPAKSSTQAILSGQTTYEGDFGQQTSLNFGQKVMGVGARMTGIDHFASIGTIQQDKKKAQAVIDSQSRETLENNLTNAQANTKQQQTKKDELQETAQLAKTRKQVADENVAKLQGKGVAKNTKEWKKATKAQKDANKALEDANKALDDQEKVLKSATDAETEAADGIKEYDAAVDTVTNAGKAQMQAFGEGCATASAALMGVGMGLGMVGSAFESLGMEETAAGFNKASQIFSTTGAVLGIIPPILSFIQMLFPGVGAASAAAGGVATASGVAATSAWSVVAVIVLIVMAAIIAVIAVVLIVMAALKKNSPAEKLKEAEKAANDAAETANRAAEAYENLNSALEDLGDKYDALDELTRGTEEWNEAVKDINDSVMDLIDEYPELAKFVENKRGVLTIDVESEGVQQVLKGVEKTKITAENTAAALQMDVERKRIDNQFANLDAVNEAGKARRNESWGDWMGASTGIGAGVVGTAGAIMGGVLGGPAGAALLGGAGAIVGATAGAIVGVIGGAIAAPIKRASAETDDKLQEATEALALSVAEGTTSTDFEDMYSFLTSMGVAENEAEAMARSFAEDTSQLKEFGDALEAEAASSKARYEQMAMQAEQLANTAGWTQEEILQGKNLIDDDVYKAMEKQAEDAVGSLDLTSKKGEDGLNNMDAEQERLLDEAIKQVYGENATRDGKKVTFTNADNERVTEKLGEREDELIEAMKQIKATELTTSAMEGTKSVIATLNSIIGGNMASKVYSDAEGGSISMKDYKALAGEDGELNNDDLQAFWDKLNDNEKQVYGGQFSIFAEDFKGAQMAAEAIADVKSQLEELGIANVDELIDENVTKDAAISMGKQFKSIAEKLAQQNLDTSAITKSGGIADQYKEIYSGLNDDLKEQLSSQFASLDTSTIEQLNKFQWELIHIYGVSEEQAAALTDSLKEATLATSEWEVTVDQFGALENVLEEVNKLLEEMTALEWEYNKALREGSGSIKELISKQVENLGQQTAKYKEAYTASQNNLATQFARGATASEKNPLVDFRDYVTMHEDGSYEIDQAKAQTDAESGVLDFDEFQTWLDSLQEAYDSMLENEEAAREAYDSLIELEQQTKEAYYELRDMAKDAVLDKIQKQIDLQEDTLAATEEANSTLISKIQQQIDETRQARENEKAEENIADRQSKLAYLTMDTSSATSLEILQTQEALKEAEQNYQDTLVDQTLQQLEDANEKAAEQRERQISIAEAQLEVYQNSAEFQRDIDNLMNEAMSADSITNTTLGQLLEDAQTGGMSSQEKEDWTTQLEALNSQAAMYQSINWAEEQQAAYDNVSTIKDAANVLLDSTKKKVANQQKTITQQGFNGVMDYETFSSSAGASHGGGEGSTYGGYEEYLNKFDTFSRQTGNTNTTDATNKATEMGNNNNKIMSQSEYNASMVDTIASAEDPSKVKTYTQYVTEEYNKYRNAFAEKVQVGDEGWFPVQFHGWNGFAKGNNNGSLDMDGAGVFTRCISFGDEVTGAKYSFLKELMKLTYSADQTGHKLNDPNAETPTGDAQGIYYGGKAYAYFDGKIREINAEYNGTDLGYNVMDDAQNSENKAFIDAILHKRQFVSPKAAFTKYKTGGLADFTGPAWLDGTPSKPEYILNAAQTDRFFSLIDVLEGYDSDKKNKRAQGGDNYFDISINVEKIEDDYDVEQMADKIRRMIYEDATYRNVNSINHIR